LSAFSPFFRRHSKRSMKRRSSTSVRKEWWNRTTIWGDQRDAIEEVRELSFVRFDDDRGACEANLHTQTASATNPGDTDPAQIITTPTHNMNPTNRHERPSETRQKRKNRAGTSIPNEREINPFTRCRDADDEIFTSSAHTAQNHQLQYRDT
jgi:hypothetical protein